MSELRHNPSGRVVSDYSGGSRLPVSPASTRFQKESIERHAVVEAFLRCTARQSAIGCWSSCRAVPDSRRSQRKNHRFPRSIRSPAVVVGIRAARRHKPHDGEHVGPRVHDVASGTLLCSGSRRPGNGQPRRCPRHLPSHGADLCLRAVCGPGC